MFVRGWKKFSKSAKQAIEGMSGDGELSLADQVGLFLLVILLALLIR